MKKRFTVSTLGCKLNFSESSAMIRELKEKGYEEIEEGTDVDLVVVNTCAVTQQAEKKCRQTIKHLIKQSPDARVIVTGCFSQLSAEKIAEIQGVALVLGNEEKISLVDFAEGEKPEKPIILISEYEKIKSFKPSYSSEGRTRCFLKVQDGCDYFCAFCTIPMARGKSRSAAISDTIIMAEEALAAGAKELVLTGINIGTFGKDTGESFLELIKALDAIEGEHRLRLGSVEPNLMKPEMIEFIAESTHFVPHFHLPLQSGSNDVLKLMKRRYTREIFAQRVQKIREVLPKAYIGVDVIVGMNGELNEWFEDAYQFLDGMDVSQLHVFSYSERPDTKALQYTPKNSPQTKKERSHRLIEMSVDKYRRFCEASIGESRSVIFEEQRIGDMMYGYTDNYVRVSAPYSEDLVGCVSILKIEKENIVL